MNRDELISLIRQPENVAPGHISDLKEMVALYPAFAHARILLAKALQKQGSIHFASGLKLAALYSSNRRGLYYYIYPEEKIASGQYRRENAAKSGDYFEMIEAVTREGEDPRQSLKNLAERLKSARSMVVNATEPHTRKNVAGSGDVEIIVKKNVIIETLPVKHSVVPNGGVQEAEVTETGARQLIRERKYKEAVEILRTLNLNNPKKSVYFADQIRFLEKVIANSKK